MPQRQTIIVVVTPQIWHTSFITNFYCHLQREIRIKKVKLSTIQFFSRRYIYFERSYIIHIKDSYPYVNIWLVRGSHKKRNPPAL